MTIGKINDALKLATSSAIPEGSRSVTYSFYQTKTVSGLTAPDLPSSYANVHAVENSSIYPLLNDPLYFQPLNLYKPDSMSIIQKSFAYITTFIPLNFSQSGSGTGQIRYAGFDKQIIYRKSGPWYNPLQITNYNVLGETKDFAEAGVLSHSDVWIYKDGLDTGSDLFWTVVHETGRGLGLLDADGISAVYNNKLTIMSYVESPSTSRLAAEYQLYDIAALQYKYGANTEAGAGKTTYTLADFSENNALTGNIAAARMRTIWDASGVDTIDASGVSSKSAYIDLRPGHFSSIGPNATDSKTIEYVGNNWKVNYTKDKNDIESLGTENISIAFGASIENATGSDANDVIVGNMLSNTLKGGAGNDMIFGDGFAIARADSILAGLNKRATGLKAETESSSRDADYHQITTSGIGAEILPTDLTTVSDTLDGGAGDDLLMGGKGNDTFINTLGDGNDVMDGGDGTDTAVYAYDAGNGVITLSRAASNSFAVVIVGAKDASGQVKDFGTDTLSSIEQLSIKAGKDQDRLVLDTGFDLGAGSKIDLGDPATTGAAISSNPSLRTAYNGCFVPLGDEDIYYKNNMACNDNGFCASAKSVTYIELKQAA